MQILPKLLSRHTGASFVAIGSRTITTDRIENMEETIRYRMYKRFLNYAKIKGFVLSYNSENSGIALINVERIDLNSTEEYAKQKISEIKRVVIKCYNDIHFPEL